MAGRQADPLGPPLHIGKVFIKGNHRTKPSVFETELQDAYAADRARILLEELDLSVAELQMLDIFDSIDVKLDKSSSGKRDETDLYIHVKEKSWRSLHMGATTDGSEEAAETTLTLANAFGNAEKMTIGASYGQAGSNTERATFSKPRFLGLPLFLNASASNELHNNEYWSSYSEKVRGGTISVSDYEGVHEVALNMGWRDILPRRDQHIPTAFRASPSILSESQPSTKTSVKYTFKDDRRNDAIYPTDGSLFQYSTEAAGLFGDVNFVRAEVAGQKHIGIGPELFGFPMLNLSLCGNFGAIKSYGEDANRPTRISDRFFLGGPLSIRGFNYKGIGPRASPQDGGVPAGDSLGGDVMYSGSASLGFPLPIPVLAVLGLRGQFFVNAGNVTSWDRVLAQNKWARHLVDDTRVSAGMGIVWGTRLGRIEANYSWVLKSNLQDNIKRAQLGLGMTFG